MYLRGCIFKLENSFLCHRCKVCIIVFFPVWQFWNLFWNCRHVTLKRNDIKLKLRLSPAVVGYASGKELYPVRSKVKCHVPINWKYHNFCQSCLTNLIHRTIFMVWCKVSSVYIFPSKQSCTTLCISRIDNKFWLIIIHHQAFSFKNHLIKTYDCS